MLRLSRDVIRLVRRPVACIAAGLAALACVAVEPSPAPHPSPTAGAQPVPHPSPTVGARRLNSVVMDVDFTEQASAGGADALDIVGTIQLILDRIAARSAPRNRFGQPRSILWLPVTASRECQYPDDAGILEVRVARFLSYNHQWIVYGRQHEEADLSFRLLDCSGRQILAYPDNGAAYGSASFSPYYVSIGGTAAALALATTHANNLNIAATIGVVNAYGPLQTNIGAHDPMEMEQLALYRLIGNIPGKNVPPPAPGTISSLLSRCSFGVEDGHIALTCPPQSP